MKKEPTDWKVAFKESLTKCIKRGDYRAGVALAQAALKKHPRDFDCRFQYAKLLGDWADELPPARKKKLKRESIAIIRPLLRSLGGKTASVRFSVCLNYYYQTESFVPMVRYGRKLAARKDREGHYAQGLGAALEAQRLNRAQSKRAKTWAMKSVSSWGRYNLTRVDYYFPHYVLALAHGVLGNKREGMKSLERAAKVSKRPVTDWEFADALELLR